MYNKIKGKSKSFIRIDVIIRLAIVLVATLVVQVIIRGVVY